MKKLIFILIFATGCSASLGSYEQGLWFDSDQKIYHPKGIGIKADLIAGQMVRPLDGWENPKYVLKCPIVGPFVSVAVGEAGFYIGFKGFRNCKGRYDWLPSEADCNEPEILFTPSASLRRTRWK